MNLESPEGNSDDRSVDSDKLRKSKLTDSADIVDPQIDRRNQ